MIWALFNGDLERREHQKSLVGTRIRTLNFDLPPHYHLAWAIIFLISLLFSRHKLFPLTGVLYPLEDLEAVTNQFLRHRPELIQSVHTQWEYLPTSWLISSRYGLFSTQLLVVVAAGFLFNSVSSPMCSNEQPMLVGPGVPKYSLYFSDSAER